LNAILLPELEEGKEYGEERLTSAAVVSNVRREFKGSLSRRVICAGNIKLGEVF